MQIQKCILYVMRKCLRNCIRLVKCAKNPKFVLCKFKKNNKLMQEWDKVNIKVDKQEIEPMQKGQIQPFLVIQRYHKDTSPK